MTAGLTTAAPRIPQQHLPDKTQLQLNAESQLSGAKLPMLLLLLRSWPALLGQLLLQSCVLLLQRCILLVQRCIMLLQSCNLLQKGCNLLLCCGQTTLQCIGMGLNTCKQDSARQ
jgi:hypothetical protein